MGLLYEKNVVLGVSGGIAAYKAIDLASKLVQAGANVNVVLTQSALEFVTPLSFEAITKQKVHSGVFEGWSEAEKGHISLAEDADMLVVAPATANVIAKLAHGIADDMLSVTHLATTPRGTPLIIAPAMEHHMYLHPATQTNLETLRSRGASMIGPGHGRLASGAIGLGRLSPPQTIVEVMELALAANGPLAGRRIVVTAGATREAIDPIRILTNRSTGKMGYAIARASALAGASVTLISAPTNLAPVAGTRMIPAESALSMLDAVREHAVGADALVMAAAVADYRPVRAAEHKIKKSDDDLAIQLTRNPDILASVKTPGTLRIGFAAETRDHEKNARGKLERKNLDLIVANDAGAAMGADTNAVTVYHRGGGVEVIDEQQKDDVASMLVARMVDLLNRPDE